MIEVQQQEYDVVIMGAGFGGVCQARHLLLTIPNIRVALIDPRGEERTDKDLKIGESTVEMAALFICKDLGLQDYMIENHPPKFGLSFHWPKDPLKTDSINDYYHIWSNRQPSILTFQMNRAKFERNILEMNTKMGAIFYKGRVIDLDLTPGDAIKTINVKVGEQYINLKAKHVIDAAGSSFIIGKKTNNLLFKPAELFGVDNGSAWVRVKNVDRAIFNNFYSPYGGTCSRYYVTNHWFGHGHWLWMIPTEIESMELSIGAMFHRDVIPDDLINTKQKFYSFLEKNHNILYQIVNSSDGVDFHYRPRVARMSKTLFSKDNWYVIGDAAYIFDAFYSTGTSMTCVAIESVTEIIRAKLAGEANAEEKRTAYNNFNLRFARIINQTVSHHAKQLGHASVMSWRIYYEYMVWFGIFLPMYIGKWHMDLDYIKKFIASADSIQKFVDELHNQFTQVVEQGKNIGLMDCFRADQLFWGYHTLTHFDDFLENTKYESKRSNLYKSVKYTYLFQIIWYNRFRWKAFGLPGLLDRKYFYHLLQWAVRLTEVTVAEFIYYLQTKNLPDNTLIEKMRQEFKNYQYRPELQQWWHKT